MPDFSTLSPLSDAELDAVTGGYDFSFHVRIDQNARGGDSLAAGGDGGNARAEGLGGTATGGVGGTATSAAGGAGGSNSISVTV